MTCGVFCGYIEAYAQSINTRNNHPNYAQFPHANNE